MDPGFAFIVVGIVVIGAVIAVSWRNAGAVRRRGSDGSYIVGAGAFGADSGSDHSHGPGHGQGHGHGGDSGGEWRPSQAMLMAASR